MPPAGRPFSLNIFVIIFLVAMGLLKQICTKLTSFSSYSTTIRFCIPPQVLLSQVASKTAQARVFKAAQLPAKISLVHDASWTKPESPGFITRYLPRSGDDGNQYQENHGEVWRSAWTTILKYAVVAGSRELCEPWT